MSERQRENQPLWTYTEVYERPVPRIEIPAELVVRPSSPTPNAGTSQAGFLAPWRVETAPIEQLTATDSWQEFKRTSKLFTKEDEILLVYDASKDTLNSVYPPAHRSAHSKETSSSKQTLDSDLSKKATFHRKQQTPVDTVDAFEVILDNLKEIKRFPELGIYFQQESIQDLGLLAHHIEEALRLVKAIPKAAVPRDTGATTFSAFLRNKILKRTRRVLDLNNLVDPGLYADFTSLYQYLDTEEIHRKWTSQVSGKHTHERAAT